MDSLKATTVRFDAASFELVRTEAQVAGVSVSQFIREAALMRTMLRAAYRDAPGRTRDFHELATEVELLARTRGRRL